MKAAVVGAGVSGLVAAYTLAKAGVQVVLYDKEQYAGGHARTEYFDDIAVDVGFMVFNQVTYPNMVKFFEDLGVNMEVSDMSFSVSLEECEWGSNGLSGLFAQKKNLLNPSFLKMIQEIVKFQYDVQAYLDKEAKTDVTLGRFLQEGGYSDMFINCYLVPVCASIWSCSSDQVLGFSASSILTFCRNHHLLQIFNRPQWLTVQGRSASYVQKIMAELEKLGCEVKLGTQIMQISTVKEEGIRIEDSNGDSVIYDKCVVAAHAPDALQMLGESATFNERRILGAFQYSYSDIYLHRDKKLMPKSTKAWCAWNFLGSTEGRVCVTYWLNLLQNLGDTGEPILVTLNPAKPPGNIVRKWWTGHPVPTPAAALAQKQLDAIQGNREIWFCGAYQGYGFHEDGLKSGMAAAMSVLKNHYSALENVQQLSFTWCQMLARAVVTASLRKFILVGRIQLLEAGGSVLDITGEECGNLECKLRVHRPDFYWKLVTRSDLGLAEAFMDRDITCIGEDGLLTLLLILIENRDTLRSERKQQSRGWWTPLLVSAAFGSAAAYLRHKLRKNSLVNARTNVSEHYDLSNDLFSLFLDETMTYSCAIFKGPEEPLVDAQLRKLHTLIDKARVESSHEVLEIGFGWGSMAIELVRRTGCNYTGISLSQEQLQLAKQRVSEAGLQDKVTLKLCDYRTISGNYDRIISCEMLEAVGPEYYQQFFAKCDGLLANDGLLVVQVITVPEERYNELRRSSDFIKEYIFPGGSLPSLTALTAAMSAASSFCIEHLENIGVHYYQTLLEWRKNFHARKADLYKLGFDDRFIRKWEYYFVYCAAGFKSCTLGTSQIVFSRPGNVRNLGHPYTAGYT